MGVFMPSASQGLDGNVTLTLGAKGVIELELTSSGEKWGRGPRLDIHSSNKARVDSPAWHLVQALSTLVSPDGNIPAIDGRIVSIRRNEGREGLDQVERGAVEARLVARVDVLGRPASPILAARTQLEFDDALRAQVTVTFPSGSCAAKA